MISRGIATIHLLMVKSQDLRTKLVHSYNKKTNYMIRSYYLYLKRQPHPHSKTFQLPDHNTSSADNTSLSPLDSAIYPGGGIPPPGIAFSGVLTEKMLYSSKHRHCDTTALVRSFLKPFST